MTYQPKRICRELTLCIDSGRECGLDQRLQGSADNLQSGRRNRWVPPTDAQKALSVQPAPNSDHLPASNIDQGGTTDFRALRCWISSDGWRGG